MKRNGEAAHARLRTAHTGGERNGSEAVKSRKSENSFEPIKLSPDEWDFRRVPENELHLCIRYEYARSAPWFTKLIETWLNSPFPDWRIGTCTRGRRRHEIVVLDPKILVRDALGRKGWSVFFDELREGIPRQIVDAGAMPWVLYADEFPRPYLSCRKLFPEWVKRYYDPAHRSKVQNAFELTERVEIENPFFSRVSERSLEEISERLSRFAGGFKVDFHQGERAIKTQFASWLKSAWPRHIAHAPTRGKRSHIYWAMLKRLAAWRLLESGEFTVNDALHNRDRLKQYQDGNPVRRTKVPPDVLPLYASPGRWHDAKHEAISTTAKLYPKPQR